MKRRVCRATYLKTNQRTAYHWSHDLVDEVISSAGHWRIFRKCCPRRRIFDFFQSISRNDNVDDRLVHFNNLFTLFAVFLRDGLFQILDGVDDGNDIGQLEEDRLHDHVDSLAKTGIVADLASINVVDLGLA